MSPKKAHPERQVVFTQEEIGGELVSLLSEGLYGNPLDALREYLQNSIDAGATRVTINCGGRSMSIRDNGQGMTMDKLVRARRVAVSDKDIRKNIGFRGIGIYSGFHLCERMRIRTKIAGSFEEHIAQFDFDGMRQVLAAERGSENSQRTPLTTLLTEHVEFWTNKDHGLEDSRTVVELINIVPLHYAALSSLNLTEEYILNTIPVGFAPNSKVGDQINADIRASWPEYRPIHVILSYPGESERAVIKKLPPDLVGPKALDVKAPNGRKIAMVWGCRTNQRKMIGQSWPDLRDIQGFVYKVKGVTIGTRGDSLRMFSQGTLYNWWTGEIWVLNDLVVPSTGRDKFEYNEASRELEVAVGKVLRQFEYDTSVFQETSRGKENLAEARAEYNRLLELSLKGILAPSDLGALSRALDKVRDVERRLRKFEEMDVTVADVRSDCRLLSDKLKQLLEGAESGEAPDGKPQKKRRRVAPTPTPEGDEDATKGGEPPVRSLGELLGDLDMTDPATAAAAASALAAAVEDVIPQAQSAYKDIARAFEAKLDELELL